MNFEKLKLTEKQMNAVKKVESALIEASRLGVSFWEDYGKLAAYNNKKIEQPSPDDSLPYRLDEHEDICYWIKGVRTFAVADDTLYFDVR